MQPAGHDDASDNWIAATALGAGIVAIGVKLAGVLPAILVEQGDLTPAIAAAFIRFSDVSFMASMMPLGLFLGAVAAIVVRSRVLPAWPGWSAAVIAPLLVANAFDLSSEFGPAFILFLLWTLIAATVLLRRAVTAASHAITAPARAVTSWLPPSQSKELRRPAAGMQRLLPARRAAIRSRRQRRGDVRSVRGLGDARPAT